MLTWSHATLTRMSVADINQTDGFKLVPDRAPQRSIQNTQPAQTPIIRPSPCSPVPIHTTQRAVATRVAIRGNEATTANQPQQRLPHLDVNSTTTTTTTTQQQHNNTTTQQHDNQLQSNNTTTTTQQHNNHLQSNNATNERKKERKKDRK